jgi:hypothetical protein
MGGLFAHPREVPMSRLPLSIFAAAGLAALTACSPTAFEPVAVTHDASTVGNCEKIGDIEASEGRFDNSEPAAQLERRARAMGANTVLVSDADGRTGVAYDCAMPSVASPSSRR